MKKISVILSVVFLSLSVFFTVSCKGGGGGGPKIKKTPEGFKVYEDKKNGFKFAHPADWKVTAFVDKGSCTVSAPGGGFFVKTHKKRENESIDKVQNNFEARFKMWGDKLEMHEKKDASLSGYDAKKYIYTMKGYSNKTQYLIFTIAKDRYYEIIYDGSAKAYEKIKDKIQTMVDTFQIL